jgi:hypothetical protein
MLNRAHYYIQDKNTFWVAEVHRKAQLAGHDSQRARPDRSKLQNDVIRATNNEFGGGLWAEG